MAGRKLDHFRHLHAILPFRNIVDKLSYDACTLDHLVHTHLEAGHSITLRAHHLVKLKFGVNAVGECLAHIACPA